MGRVRDQQLGIGGLLGRLLVLQSQGARCLLELVGDDGIGAVPQPRLPPER